MFGRRKAWICQVGMGMCTFRHPRGREPGLCGHLWAPVGTPGQLIEALPWYAGPAAEMGDDPSASVILFVKYPTPGAVKTRLAADIGSLPASQLYRACAEHTLRIACRCCPSMPAHSVLHYKRKASQPPRCCAGVQVQLAPSLLRLLRSIRPAMASQNTECACGWTPYKL